MKIKKNLLLFFSLFFSLVLSRESFSAADLTTYFCDTYDTCRSTFLKKTEALVTKAGFEDGKIENYRVPSKIDKNLFIDSLYLPAKDKEENLLILASGVHGVEGFAGSSMQHLFLEKMLPNLDRKKLGILVIHAINPYGFKYLRRVSENNVDLNRNFDTVKELFSSKNEDYGKLNELLNPSTPATNDLLAEANFYYKVIRFLAKEPIKVLRQATLKGQYEYEKGIYYGGKEFEPQKKILEPVLIAKSKNYKNVLILDLHTGYGKRGHLHLFPNSTDDKKLKEAMKVVFGDYPMENAEGDDFYDNYGDFSNYVYKLMTQEKKFSIPMVLEYGTVNNHDNYYWAVESLRRMIAENQFVHYKADTKQTELKIKKQFIELYYPSSVEWRKKIAEVTFKVLPDFIKRFQKIGQ